MGNFSDRLSGRLRGVATKPVPKPDVERLKYAAIQRAGETHSGLRSHYEIRSYLGDTDPQKPTFGDIEGFLTTTGRFVTRDEAQDVAVTAGQLRQHQRRPLLSSDLDW